MADDLHPCSAERQENPGLDLPGTPWATSACCGMTFTFTCIWFAGTFTVHSVKGNSVPWCYIYLVYLSVSLYQTLNEEKILIMYTVDVRVGNSRPQVLLPLELYKDPHKVTYCIELPLLRCNEVDTLFRCCGNLQ